MRHVMPFAFVVVGVLTTAVVFGAGCGASSSAASSPTAEAMKPKPVISALTAETSGMLDNYYATLNITVKNEGAAGTVVVLAGITQGSQTMESEFPLYITHNDKQTLKLVFPLKWEGGDWTPSVRTEVH